MRDDKPSQYTDIQLTEHKQRVTMKKMSVPHVLGKLKNKLFLRSYGTRGTGITFIETPRSCSMKLY